jgi:hypothetical protein
MRRKIGASLEAGSGFIYCDELGRVPDVYARLEPLLSLNSSVAFELKYANVREARVDAAIVLLGSSLPASIVKSPELSRRAVGFRLLNGAPNWQGAVAEVGDIADIRKMPELRGAVDVVVGDVWWKLHALGPGGNWRRLCLDTFDAVELPALDLDDVGGEARDEVIRSLYQSYRDPNTKVSMNNKYKGWLEADPGTAAGDLLAQLIDFEGTRGKAFAECEDLHKLDLGAVLGFCIPKLTLRVHRQSGHWYLKFVQLGVRKGDETRREDLPQSRRPAQRETANDFKEAPDPPAPPGAPVADVGSSPNARSAHRQGNNDELRPRGSGGTNDCDGLETGETAGSAENTAPTRRVRV